MLHVAEIGLDRAADAAILDWAPEEQRTVCTLDADFHALLAVSGQRAPSVIRVRVEGLRGPELARLLLRIWPDIFDSVSTGAVVSVTARDVRIRKLPVKTGDPV